MIEQTNLILPEEKELIEYADFFIYLINVCNKTKNKIITRIYNDYASRFIEFLYVIKPLASKNAYREFYELSEGKDIRNYNWDNSIKIDGKYVSIHTLFAWEHKTTAYNFRKNLQKLFDNNNLNTDNVINLIRKQKICWVTKQENNELNKLGYKKERETDKNLREITPKMVYALAGIEIETSEVMPLQAKTNKTKEEYIFFIDLKNYFTQNFKHKNIILKTYGTEYATIYRKLGVWVYVRIKKDELNDIGIYIEGNNAKHTFDNLIKNRDELEQQMGYKLVWDRNDKKKSVRISRFGKFSNDKNRNMDYATTYSFDLDIPMVTNELLNFYNAFIHNKI